jgi:hypothetical protein
MHCGKFDAAHMRTSKRPAGRSWDRIALYNPPLRELQNYWRPTLK